MSSIKSDKYYYAAGKRKTSIARVYLSLDSDTPSIIVNGKSLSDYFPSYYQGLVNSPLVLTDNINKFSIKLIVKGGGYSSQSQAIRHGLSKALEIFNPELRLLLKNSGFLIRDSRIKERKKFGLKKARKSPQWSKR
jgi:small subunit ribosomal protein S9